MNLEPVTQSEVRKKKANIMYLYIYIYIYIWNLEINGTDEPICRVETETQR